MSAPSRRSADGPKAAVRLKRGERRRQLIVCAKNLFLQSGYEALSLEKVAEELGVSPSVAARHFADRTALLQGVVDDFRAETLQKWTTETAELPDALARLHALADAFVAATRDRADLFRALHRLLVEPADEKVLAVVRSYYLEAETLLEGIIAEGQQSGVFRRSLDARIGAWQLIHTALGYSLTRPLALPIDEEPDAIPRALDCLLHCLLKTDV